MLISISYHYNILFHTCSNYLKYAWWFLHANCISTPTRYRSIVQITCRCIIQSRESRLLKEEFREQLFSYIYTYWLQLYTETHTSLEWRRAGRSVGSPDELNVQWNESAGGEASTSHFNVSVSCFRAPISSSWVVEHIGASKREKREENFFLKVWNGEKNKMRNGCVRSLDFG